MSVPPPLLPLVVEAGMEFLAPLVRFVLMIPPTVALLMIALGCAFLLQHQRHLAINVPLNHHLPFHVTLCAQSNLPVPMERSLAVVIHMTLSSALANLAKAFLATILINAALQSAIPNHLCGHLHESIYHHQFRHLYQLLHLHQCKQFHHCQMFRISTTINIALKSCLSPSSRAL